MEMSMKPSENTPAIEPTSEITEATTRVRAKGISQAMKMHPKTISKNMRIVKVERMWDEPKKFGMNSYQITFRSKKPVGRPRKN